MNAVLSFDITVSHGAFKLEAQATIDAPITAVFGPSGAGKTTLLHAIAGLIAPDRGFITIGRRSVFERTARRQVRVHRRRVGVVFQEPRLFPHMNVRGNLRYGLPSKPAASCGFDDIVGILELEQLLERKPHGLSGGEQRRVALGRALLSEPDLLLLDEPFAGLDQRLRRQILPLLKRIQAATSTPMLLVSHDLTEILQLTDHLLLLSGGKIAGHGAYLDLARQIDTLSVIHRLGMTNVIVLDATSRRQDGALRIHSERSDMPDRYLYVPQAEPVAGRSVVAIRPEDVALAQQPIEQISIQNQIEGTVTSVTAHDAMVLVGIDIGQPILVEVTPRSVEQLGLEPGASTWCLIKSTAIQCIA